jgi:hypothetical protein
MVLLFFILPAAGLLLFVRTEDGIPFSWRLRRLLLLAALPEFQAGAIFRPIFQGLLKSLLGLAQKALPV